jgi:hypothetical protein
VANGGEDDVDGVAVTALEMAAAEVAIALHVTDDGLDGRAAPELALNDTEDATLLTGDEDAARAFGCVVPDNVSGLPSLPSRQAVLLGWATPIPVLVEVDELPDAQRPQSADPDFWNVWTPAEERGADWGAVSKAWSGTGPVPKAEEE